uniref:Uncharacterized protein n=1 Tax=Panagrolaimus sp. JU765 TaxID=591449 RepID=A0AC34R7L9_9BILA
MQESHENSRKSYEGIINRMQDNQFELEKTLVSQEDKNRDFMREITAEYVGLNMRTNEMLTDINNRTLENINEQQKRYLGEQKAMAAIHAENREREEIRRLEKEEREAHERRQHELDMEKIRQRPHKGIFGTIGGWIDSVFSGVPPAPAERSGSEAGAEADFKISGSRSRSESL